MPRFTDPASAGAWQASVARDEPVVIGTPCGLGRRTPEEASRVVDRMRVLLD